MKLAPLIRTRIYSTLRTLKLRQVQCSAHWTKEARSSAQQTMLPVKSFTKMSRQTKQGLSDLNPE